MSTSNDLNVILLNTLRSVVGVRLNAQQEQKVEALAQWALVELMRQKEQSIERVSAEFIKLQTSLQAHVGVAQKANMNSVADSGEPMGADLGKVGQTFNSGQIAAFFKMRAPCIVEYPDGDDGAMVVVLPSGKVYGIGGSEPACRLEQLEGQKNISYPKQLSNMFSGNIETLRDERAQEFLRFYQESAKYAVENQVWQMEQAKELEKELGALFAPKTKKGIHP